MRANDETKIILEFIMSKLEAVGPNIAVRDFTQITASENIAWIEKFIDALFCVPKTKDLFQTVSFTFCKVKNCHKTIEARQYVIKIKVLGDEQAGCTKDIVKTYSLMFLWNNLTANDARSFLGVIKSVVDFLVAEVKALDAQNTLPLLA